MLFGQRLVRWLVRSNFGLGGAGLCPEAPGRRRAGRRAMPCPSDKVRQQPRLAKLPSCVGGPADPKVHLLGFEPGSSVLKSSPITAQPSGRYWIYFHAWCSSGVTSLEVSSVASPTSSSERRRGRSADVVRRGEERRSVGAALSGGPWDGGCVGVGRTRGP